MLQCNNAIPGHPGTAIKVAFVSKNPVEWDGGRHDAEGSYLVSESVSASASQSDPWECRTSPSLYLRAYCVSVDFRDSLQLETKTWMLGIIIIIIMGIIMIITPKQCKKRFCTSRFEIRNNEGPFVPSSSAWLTHCCCCSYLAHWLYLTAAVHRSFAEEDEKQEQSCSRE